MTAFWATATIFIMVALLFVIPVLLRNKKNKSQEQVERQAANIAIYRDQIAELDRDLRDDTLSKEQYESSKQELQKRMLQDVSENTDAASVIPNSQHGVVASIIVALTIPLAAIYLYMVIGDTRGLLPQSQLANAAQFEQNGDEGGTPSGHSEINSMVDSLAARLKENPEDVEGWVMLGRSYAIMERFADASAVYDKLIQLVQIGRAHV